MGNGQMTAFRRMHGKEFWREGKYWFTTIGPYVAYFWKSPQPGQWWKWCARMNDENRTGTLGRTLYDCLNDLQKVMGVQK